MPGPPPRPSLKPLYRQPQRQPSSLAPCEFPDAGLCQGLRMLTSAFSLRAKWTVRSAIRRPAWGQLPSPEPFRAAHTVRGRQPRAQSPEGAMPLGKPEARGLGWGSCRLCGGVTTPVGAGASGRAAGPAVTAPGGSAPWNTTAHLGALMGSSDIPLPSLDRVSPGPRNRSGAVLGKNAWAPAVSLGDVSPPEFQVPEEKASSW